MHWGQENLLYGNILGVENLLNGILFRWLCKINLLESCTYEKEWCHLILGIYVKSAEVTTE